MVHLLHRLYGVDAPVRNTHKLFNLSGEISIVEEKKCKANGVHEAINHFACNFAKSSPILKILSPAD